MIRVLLTTLIGILVVNVGSAAEIDRLPAVDFLSHKAVQDELHLSKEQLSELKEILGAYRFARHNAKSPESAETDIESDMKVFEAVEREFANQAYSLLSSAQKQRTRELYLQYRIEAAWTAAQFLRMGFAMGDSQQEKLEKGLASIKGGRRTDRLLRLVKPLLIAYFDKGQVEEMLGEPFDFASNRRGYRFDQKQKVFRKTPEPDLKVPLSPLKANNPRRE